MWFWKRKKYRLATEYDAYEEAQGYMKEYEQKYGISSYEFYYKTTDFSIFEGNDQYYWETYIRSFLRCGGILNTNGLVASPNQ